MYGMHMQQHYTIYNMIILMVQLMLAASRVSLKLETRNNVLQIFNDDTMYAFKKHGGKNLNMIIIINFS